MFGLRDSGLLTTHRRGVLPIIIAEILETDATAGFGCFDATGYLVLGSVHTLYSQCV
jgi:hypothetical protein